MANKGNTNPLLTADNRNPNWDWKTMGQPNPSTNPFFNQLDTFIALPLHAKQLLNLWQEEMWNPSPTKQNALHAKQIRDQLAEFGIVKNLSPLQNLALQGITNTDDEVEYLRAAAYNAKSSGNMTKFNNINGILRTLGSKYEEPKGVAAPVNTAAKPAHAETSEERMRRLMLEWNQLQWNPAPTKEQAQRAQQVITGLADYKIRVDLPHAYREKLGLPTNAAGRLDFLHPGAALLQDEPNFASQFLKSGGIGAHSTSPENPRKANLQAEWDALAKKERPTKQEAQRLQQIATGLADYGVHRELTKRQRYALMGITADLGERAYRLNAFDTAIAAGNIEKASHLRDLISDVDGLNVDPYGALVVAVIWGT